MRFGRLRREDCSTGTQYYTCASNGFSGCCSVDACDYTDGCPDSSSSETTGTSASSSAARALVTATVTTITSSSGPSLGGELTLSAHASTIATWPSLEPADTTSSTTSTGRTAKTTSTTSTTSITSTTHAIPTATNNGSSSSGPSAGLGKGAIAGIVTAGLLAFILLAAFEIWRHCWQRQQPRPQYQQCRLEQQEQLTIGNAGPTDVLEKAVENDTSPVPSKPTRPIGSSKTSSLFGEATAAMNTLETVLARWGLRGSRLVALRNSRLMGSLRSRSDVADLGSFLGPVAETPGQAISSPDRFAELDTQSPAVLAELESQTHSHSAFLPHHSSAMSTRTGRRNTAATFVLSWRSSGTGSTAGMLGPDAVTPELHSTPRMESSSVPLVGSAVQGGPSRMPTTEDPRATLNVTHKDQVRGLHVGSWASYRL